MSGNDRFVLQRTALENSLLSLVKMYFCVKLSSMCLFVVFGFFLNPPYVWGVFVVVGLWFFFFSDRANMMFLLFTSMFDIA